MAVSGTVTSYNPHKAGYRPNGCRWKDWLFDRNSIPLSSSKKPGFENHLDHFFQFLFFNSLGFVNFATSKLLSVDDPCKESSRGSHVFCELREFLNR